MSERIQKVLAREGLGSRREIESWVKEGRIRVNGTVAGLGDRIAINDKILVDGRPVSIDRLAENSCRIVAEPLRRFVRAKSDRRSDRATFWRLCLG